MRASESASRSVTETNSPSKAEALICMLYRSSVPVGGRAQPVPAAEGVASPRRQCVSAHDVPGEGAQGFSWKPPIVKLAEATELWLLERTRKSPHVVSVIYFTENLYTV